MLRAALIVTLCVATSGCDDQHITGHGRPFDPAAADAKPAHHYLISAIDVPDRPAENDSHGFDLDDDIRHHIDNRAGELIQLGESLLDRTLQQHIVDELRAGRMNTLVELHSDGFGDQREVSLEVRPVVSEDGRLRATASSSPLQRIYGNLRGGRFVTQQPGQISLHLAMFAGQPALAVELLGARADGEVGPHGLTALRLGGGVPTTQVQRDLVPALFPLVTARIANSPGDRNAETVFHIFDRDRNLTLTVEEFAANHTLQALLSPDMDLAEDDALPHFVPARDGHKDSISLGVRVDAIPIAF